MVKICTYIIRLYQYISHAIFPKACRFYPSCSQYAIEALKKHGLRKGCIMALARIVRCSPLSKGGFDPVK